jgi:hypothetical protein
MARPAGYEGIGQVSAEEGDAAVRSFGAPLSVSVHRAPRNTSSSVIISGQRRGVINA